MTTNAQTVLDGIDALAAQIRHMQQRSPHVRYELASLWAKAQAARDAVAGLADAPDRVTPEAGTRGGEIDRLLAQKVEFDIWVRTTPACNDARTLAFAAWKASRHAPVVPVPQIEEVRDNLVAISAAIADQDDSAAQSMLRDLLALLAAAPKAP